MLRIDDSEAPIIRVSGSLAGFLAVEARRVVGRQSDPSALIFDLSEVTFVDTIGEEILRQIAELGVRFTADNMYPLQVCERLRLRLVMSPDKS